MLYNNFLKFILLLALLSCPWTAFSQEEESSENKDHEQQLERSIAQEEPQYQKDVPMEEEAQPQAPHDMDDSQLLPKQQKSKY